MNKSDEKQELFNFAEEYCLSCKRVVPANKVRCLAGDASTRRYYRIGESPNSFIVCYDASFVDEQHDFFVLQKYLLQKGIRTPHILHNSKENHLMLLEDLGDETFLAKLSQIKNFTEEYSYYQELVDNIIKFQTFKINDNADLSCYNRFFDREKYWFEINMTNEYLLEKFFKRKLSDKEKIIIQSFWDDILKDLTAYNSFFVHRDYHSRNVMVKDNLLYIIDFQDARIGHPLYDLVSLLDDCYYALDNDNYMRLKEYYFKRATSEKLIKWSHDEFLVNYDKMLLERAYKALGSFSMLYARDNSVRYLKHIGFVVEKIKRVLCSDSRYSDFKNLFMKIYYES
jgi:hypothetical protein